MLISSKESERAKKYIELVGTMVPENPQYTSFLSSLDNSLRQNPHGARREVERTLFWKHLVPLKNRFWDIAYLLDTPPVGYGESSNRVLVVGTDREVEDMTNFPQLIPQITEGFDRPEIVYLSQAGKFWSSFFGQEFFLDAEDVSIPAAIVGTGKIGSHYRGEDSFNNIEGRLTEITEEWGIEFRKIRSWDH